MADSSKPSKGKVKGGGGGGSGKKGVRKQTKLGISAKKSENLPVWYNDTIKYSEMIDNYDVSGCYILRPWAFEIWEQIVAFFDGEIKKLGVRPCYFPVFVTPSALEAEADHVEGFAPEVAWVTRSGDSKLDVPLALRPTSETIMYPAYSKWIRSHRDLPLRLNQWTNVVRWEFKHPTPFLRTREFLWQEGHSAFATKEEADKEVLEILDLYARNYEEILAVPVIKGRKSEKEKFAGGLYTTTVEAFIPAAGRAIQGATSHALGQNFANIFNIEFLDKDEKKRKVWQNSWGFTTRSIGVMIMVHGDDNGLVLPPRVAPIQVVIVFIEHASDSAEMKVAIKKRCELVEDRLRKAGIRVRFDDNTHQTPAWKFAHWEQKGVPLRLEIGPKDLESDTVFSARRDNRSKASIKMDSLEDTVSGLLDTIQKDMLTKARKERDEHLEIIMEFDELLPALNRGNMALAPWCERTECEEYVKETTKKLSAPKKATEVEDVKEAEEAAKSLSGAAKTLCIPMDQAPMPEGQKCFCDCGSPAKAFCLWGRSY